MIGRLIRGALVAASMAALLAVPLHAAQAQSQPQTTADIVKKGKISIGVLTGIPPYTTVDSSGNPDGFLVDLAREVAKAMGVQLEVVPVNNSSRAAALQSGRVDMLIAMMTATPERALTFLMTNPYGAYDMRFVAKKSMQLKSLDDLKGKRVSVPTGSTQDIAISGFGIEGLQVVRFDDDALAMQALISGQVDASAQVATVANDVIAKQHLDELEVKQDLPIYTLYWSMAVPKGATELHQWLNNLIYYDEVTGKLNELHKKWVGVPMPGGKLPTF